MIDGIRNEKERLLLQDQLPLPDPRSGHRLRELDALRGVAALSVVFLHFHDMWLPKETVGLTLGERAALFFTRPFYSGEEAVVLFFVLSGLVLSLPYLKGKAQKYPKFLVRRVLRIYGPYLAALVLGILGAAIFHGHGVRTSWSQAFWSRPVERNLVIHHILFMGLYDWEQYNFVIWSLIQEMRISILFPLLAWIYMRLGAKASLSISFAASLTTYLLLGKISTFSAYPFTLHIVIFFMAGIAVAANLGRIQFWWDRTSTLTHASVGLASLVVYTYNNEIARVILDHLLGPGYMPLWHLMGKTYLNGLGAVGLIVLSLHAAPLRKLLTSAPGHFLGRISYSLYLVHPIVLLALTFSLGRSVSPWVQLPLYVAAALVLAWLFCKAVEETFIRISRSV